MSLPVSVVITGIDTLKVLDQALDAAHTFKSLDAVMRSTVATRIQNAARHGNFKRYKTTSVLDATANYPVWLR